MLDAGATLSIVVRCLLKTFTCHHSWGFWTRLGTPAVSLLAFEFVTLALFYVAFVLVVTMFATKPTSDGTSEVILMVHCFSIFSVLLSFQLQHATTVMIAVRGMTTPPIVIDRFAVEEWG